MPYTPSAKERQAFRRLLARRTPAASTYRKYEDAAARWIGMNELVPQTVRFAGHSGRVIHARMHTSELFTRAYLVAYVDERWLHRIAPKCDAVASRLAQAATSTAHAKPPLVIVPETRARARSERFRSILEHEFVHVNQMLMSAYLEPSVAPIAEALLENFLNCARVEYEANLLQLTRWPRLYPSKYGLTLDHWCVLRGYSQSLEKTLLLFAERNVPPKQVMRFLEMFPGALASGFDRGGMDTQLVSWFRDRWLDHLLVALGEVLNHHPDATRNESFRAAGRWWKSQMKDS